MNEQMLDLLRRKWVIPTSVGLAAFSGGGVLGYILGKRKERKGLELRRDYVLELAKQEGVEVTDDSEGIRVITEGKIDSLSLIPHEDVVFDVPPITVVRQPLDDIVWDWEAEKSTRTKEEPYVIHKDEFMADEMGYTQSTVTYYSGDDILTDELDVPIYGHTAMVGELKFGHGSGDESVVYIRSELLEHEYEVILHEGRYEVEVLGHEIDEKYKDEDLKHSIVPKFRLE